MPKAKPNKRFLARKAMKVACDSKTVGRTASVVVVENRRRNKANLTTRPNVSSNVTASEIEEAYYLLAQREDEEIDRAIETIKEVIKEKNQHKKL